MLLRILWLAVMAISLVACAQVKTDKAVTQSLVAGSVQKDEPMSDEVLVEPSNLSSELLYSLLGGEIAGQRGDVSMASAFYLSAAKRSQDPGIALRAAQIALYNKDVAAAKLAVDILVEDKNASVQAKRLALTVYLRAGDVEKSLSQIRLLLEKNEIPKRNALLAIGDVVSRHANKNTAISVMTVLVGENVKEAGVFVARSQIMSNFSLFNQAQKDANKAVELDANWQTGYVQLAQVLERKGDRQAALLVLKEASEKLKARQLLMVYAQLLAKNKQYLAAKEQ
ncbi:MAG TPA: hypothetical protein EYG47_04280, partial [Cycloclasticus sp.]|nr:hypothetical protein [Cycloclasticus sp.]